MTASKHCCRFGALALLAGVLAIPDARAQSSASYSLEEASLNSGGHPEAGVVLFSASFRITQDSVAESLAHVRLNGPTLVMEGGFVSLNPPPVEVTTASANWRGVKMTPAILRKLDALRKENGVEVKEAVA